MPFDPLSTAKVGWSVIGAVWKFFRRNRRNLTPQDRLNLRTKWKPQFQDYLHDHQVKKLRQDVIIRDMKRMDSYPETKEQKGISAWFRVGLIDTYEKGIMVGLGWEGLVADGDGFRRTDWKTGENGTVTAMLTGFIPYENIESVDWSGDGYYGYPHIYCYFDIKGQPYERLAFCEKRDNNGWEFFSEIADYNAVRKLTKKRGIKR